MSKRTIQALRRSAARLPDVEEGIACAGTALESLAFKARKKTFLFVSAKQARLKLDDSLAEAAALAKSAPGLYGVGAHGWVTLTLEGDAKHDAKVLDRWVAESYRVVAGAKAR